MLKPNFETKRIILLLILGLILPFALAAQAPSSTNYRLESSEFDFGGGLSTSTNYGNRGALGDVETGKTTSTNYNLFSAFFPRAYPGIPSQPTLTNTGGILYNALDFVVGTGGNLSDVNYAIAISTDNFVSNFNFVQADDTVGTSTAWQTYVNWGGAGGQRIIGLLPNTTYTIKVKARYGPNSETGYSLTAQASTVNPTLSLVVAGVNSGTSFGSNTTNIGTTATSVAFSSLQSGAIRVGAQQLTVTTNALGGYTITLAQNQDLSKTNGTKIPPVTAPNSAPAAWPGGITTAAFGYHSTDGSLCTGTTNRFSADNTFAAASTTPYEVICNTGPVSNEVNDLIFKVEVESLQAAGDYKNQISYVISPQY